MSKSSGGDISQSVEEANKLRASLGIKPLQDSTGDKEGSSKNPKASGSDKPTGPSDADVKRSKAAAKNKREHEEFTKGEGLGDILAREEGGAGASDWVSKTRNKDGSMKTAGPASTSEGKKRKAKDAPEASEMPKMKVRHDAGQIDDEGVVLTLSDQHILNDKGEINNEGDELSNARMIDMERAKHNQALKDQKEYDRDKDGQDILEKYNELKTGPKGFVIGGRTVGVIEEQDPEKRLAILTALTDRQNQEGLRLQKDYYTTEEMNKFRKPPKKKVKRRGAKESKEDQLGGPAPIADPRPQDAGSDEEDPELYEQLSKQRRLVRRSEAGAVKKGEAALAAVSERVQGIDEKDLEDEDEQVKIHGTKVMTAAEMINMTATTEFCNVVQTPLEKMDTMKHESFRGSTLYKQQAAQRKGVKMSSQKKTAGLPLEEKDKADIDLEQETETLTEEPLDMSIASGLVYLRARAQMGCDQDSHRNRKTDNRPLEMSTLDGDIKLEYRDDYGRVQTPKEAFRAISWKFHGKIPGRKNMERRLLRLENEMRLKAMNPVEALPTLRALRHVQRADAKPYMVLSGANEK